MRLNPPVRTNYQPLQAAPGLMDCFLPMFSAAAYGQPQGRPHLNLPHTLPRPNDPRFPAFLTGSGDGRLLGL
jgi:hypothetical protein